MHPDLIAAVKRKRELAGIPDGVVQEALAREFRRTRYAMPFRKKQEKQLIKVVRARLRQQVGQFSVPVALPKQYTPQIIHQLLATNPATRERESIYPALKKKIAAVRPRTILDLGCGYNPLALATRPTQYYAVDINEHPIRLVEDFFKKQHLPGTAWVQDLRNPARLPPADVCLMLKLLDVIDETGHKQAEALIKHVQATHLIMSFATKTRSGAPMRHPHRGWIARLLTRLGYRYTAWHTPNEVLYIAQKESAPNHIRARPN